MKASLMKAALPAAGPIGWFLVTAAAMRAWLSACCGFDAFSPAHYAFVWRAFLGGAVFHTAEHAAFLLTWPALLAWIWLTLVHLPVPVALNRLLEAGLSRMGRPEPEEAPAGDSTPALPAGLGDPLPPAPPPPAPAAASVAQPAVQPSLPAMTPSPAPAAAARPPAPPRPAAPVPAVPTARPAPEEYRPAGVAPVSQADLLAALAEVPGDAQCAALRERLLDEADAPALAAAGVGLVAAFAIDEHRRVGEAMGFRPALGLDEEGDGQAAPPLPAPPLPDELLDLLDGPGLVAWKAGSWSDGSVPCDGLLVALGGRSVYAIVVWGVPGRWADAGAGWAGPDGKVLPSPVLAADAVARTLVERLDALVPASCAFDVQALVLVLAGAAVQTTQATDTAWQDLRVDVCSIDGEELPSLVSLVGAHLEAPDRMLCSVLDAEMERVG